MDLSPLERAVAGMIGLPVNLRAELNPREKIEIESDNLIGGAGIFRSAMTRVGVSLYLNPMQGKVGEFYSSVSLSFELVGGGSNGVSIGFATYSFSTKKWVFTPSGARS